KNYGAGLKYGFNTAKGEDHFFSEYIDTENVYDYPIFGYHTTSFKEQTHFFGPAAYARWYLGGTQWSVPANIGIVYLYDKLSKLKKGNEYHYTNPPYYSFLLSPPASNISTYGDLTGIAIGVTFSVGANYQLIPAIGIHVSVNGMFASMSKMNSTDMFDEPVTVDVSRKFNRIGFAAGLNYNF
ncbi:MAG: hypothetical protein LBU62_07555, partial [Bacteroidales bacterium]|nr:hypothetical protein [Bacteroidales bacterium]